MADIILNPTWNNLFDNFAQSPGTAASGRFLKSGDTGSDLRNSRKQEGKGMSRFHVAYATWNRDVEWVRFGSG
jgi:hypothetical protein